MTLNVIERLGRYGGAEHAEFARSGRLQTDLASLLQDIEGQGCQPARARPRDLLTALAAVGRCDNPPGGARVPLTQHLQRHALVKKRLEIVEPQHGAGDQPPSHALSWCEE